MPANGIEVLGVHPNSNGELWYYMGLYRNDGLTHDWTIVANSALSLANTTACASLPLVTFTGGVTVAPSPTTDLQDRCLFILNDTATSYSLEGVRDRTNGGMPTILNIDSNVPVLVTQIHLNQQYARVLYKNSAGIDQTQRWVKFVESGISRNSACITEVFAPFMTEAELPECTTSTVLNCRPATAIAVSRIFGQAAIIKNAFNSTGGGCNNTNPFCYEPPNDTLNGRPPCPEYPLTEEANCGIDLWTANDAPPGVVGSKTVYAYCGGLLGGYSGSSGTLALIVRNSNGLNVTRYNYTHIDTLYSSLLSSSTSLYEYVARGIQLGTYGPIGAYGGTEDEEHIDTVQVNIGSTTPYSDPPWNSGCN